METYRDVPDGVRLEDILPPVMWHGVQERFVRERRWDVSPFSEGSAEFRHRVVTVVEGILALHKGGHLAIVCHGGVINAYIGHMLGPARGHVLPAGARLGQPGPGSVTTRRVIHTLNELHHLARRRSRTGHFLERASSCPWTMVAAFRAVPRGRRAGPRRGSCLRISRSAAGTAGSAPGPAVRWPDGREETFILRGDPPAGSGVFASDRDAEWELLCALPDRRLGRHGTALAGMTAPVSTWAPSPS